MAPKDKPQASANALTRSLVLRHLRQPDEDDSLEQVSRSSLATSTEISCTDSVASSNDAQSSVEGGEREDCRLPADANLQQIVAWLDAECEKELDAVAWTADFEHIAIRNDVPSKGLKTDILERIRRGHGPRPSRFEDLLAPLRLTDSGKTRRYSKRPIKETYKSMEKTLREWNKHVADPVYDDSKGRELLMDAMCGRIIFLNRALNERRSADAHEDTCRKLLHAIHVYRPETVDFETEDPMDLLTIIIAHRGYAIPDIDNDLKYRILYTLVTEWGYSAHVANEDLRRKYEEKIADARKRGDVARAVKFEQKMGAWISAGLKKNCDSIIARIKTARRNVELKGLKELQELTVLQTAQKLVLNDRITHKKPPYDALVPRSVWWAERAGALDAADQNLQEKIKEHLQDLDTSFRAVSRTADEMKDVNNARVLTRARKFVGLDLKDVSEIKRERIVQQRMAHPGTVPMMTDAMKGITENNGKARDAVESLTHVDRRLEELLEAVTRVHEEYYNLSKLVNSDPHMVLGGDEDAEFS
jgi:hypothetical protein